MKRAAVLVAVGLGAGLAMALPLGRFGESFLYEVSPTDPVTFAGTAILLALVAASAALLPASRAAKIDPVVALRQE
jgi:ABC-type antimicrobial peptide transport system permease subunit